MLTWDDIATKSFDASRRPDKRAPASPFVVEYGSHIVYSYTRAHDPLFAAHLLMS